MSTLIQICQGLVIWRIDSDSCGPLESWALPMAVPSSQPSTDGHCSAPVPPGTWSVESPLSQLPWTASGNHNPHLSQQLSQVYAFPPHPTQGGLVGPHDADWDFPLIGSQKRYRLCYFSMDAATNYPKFSSSNNTNVLSWSAIDYKSNMGLTGLKSRCQQGCIPFWRLQYRTHSLALSNFQKLLSFLGLWYPTSIFKISNIASSCAFLQ